VNLHIKNGRIIDPANEIDAVADLYIADGRIAAVGRAPRDFRAAEVIDAKKFIVSPGWVDLSARLREPGQDQKATIAGETRAAAAGGVTTLCCPPDTRPVIDTPAVVELIHQRAAQSGRARVVCLGALTQELKGEVLAAMHSLKRAGCVGVSNAMAPMVNTEVLRRALEYARTCDLTVFLHAEDAWLAGQGCIHEGAFSTRLGLPGIPETAETVAVARDLLLIEHTGARAHFCRLSTARAAMLVAEAMRRGLPVTTDVSVQHLFHTDAETAGFNSAYHVRPPFRSPLDRDGLRKALRAGVISAVCSDHQPQDQDAQRQPFAATEPGISALETWLPLMLRLVRDKVLDLPAAVAACTIKPARILGSPAGTLTAGASADVCIFDPQEDWVVAEDTLLSTGKNTPLLGEHVQGRVRVTLLGGKVIHRAARSSPSRSWRRSARKRPSGE